MEAEENGAEVDIDVDVDVDVDADVRGYKLEQEEGGEGKGAQRRPGGKKRRQRSSVLPDPRRDNGQGGYCGASFRASRPSKQAIKQAGPVKGSRTLSCDVLIAMQVMGRRGGRAAATPKERARRRRWRRRGRSEIEKRKQRKGRKSGAGGVALLVAHPVELLITCKSGTHQRLMHATHETLCVHVIECTCITTQPIIHSIHAIHVFVLIRLFFCVRP